MRSDLVDDEVVADVCADQELVRENCSAAGGALRVSCFLDGSHSEDTARHGTTIERSPGIVAGELLLVHDVFLDPAYGG